MPSSTPAPGFNPFPGLRPFRIDEDHLFFGREDQVRNLVNRLDKSRFVAVVGTSGSGKSSLVRCGLLSALQRGTLVQAGSHWEVAVMQPGGDPGRDLALALIAADLYDSGDDEALPRVLATLGRSRFGLTEAVRQSDMEKEGNLLLVVDQFEELFRFRKTSRKSADDAASFVRLLLEATSQSEHSIYVVLTMRSDFLGDCSQYSGLAEAVNDGEYLIPRLSRDQTQLAIEGPARVAGGQISWRLLQRLLLDLEDDSDRLPVMQHCLMRIWDAWTSDHQEGESVDLRHYEATGGMASALSKHADEVLQSLPGDEYRRVAERLFKALTETGEEGRKIRRPQRLGGLVAISGHEEEIVGEVVEAYRQPGVTLLMPPANVPLEPTGVIDISHESLMRVWERLRHWVEEEEQSAGIYRRLAETSRLWKAGKAGLYHDPDLQIAQSWKVANEPNEAWAELYGGQFDNAINFLDQSEEEARRAEREAEEVRRRELERAKELAEARERAARYFKRFALGMAAVAVIALVAFLDAIKAKNEANDLKQEAEGAKAAAETAERSVTLNFARFDAKTGNTLVKGRDFSGGIAHFSRSLSYEPDNPRLVDRIFNLLAYEAPPGYRSPELDFGGSLVYATASRPDATLVATGVWRNNGGGVDVWKPGSDRPVHVLDQGRDLLAFNSLDISPDGRHLVIGSINIFGADANKNKIRIVDLEDGATIQELPQWRNVLFVRYSRNGKKILAAADEHLGVWNVETPTEPSPLAEFNRGQSGGFWSPDETKLLLTSYERDEKASAVVDLASGELIATFEHEIASFEHEFRMPDLASFSPDGKSVLTRSEANEVASLWVWNIASGEKLELKHDAVEVADLNRFWPEEDARNPPRRVYIIGAFTPDGQRILSAGSDATIRLWNGDDGKQIGENYQVPKAVTRDRVPLFSADGRRVMLPGRDGTCYYGTFDAEYSALPKFSDARPIPEGYAFLANSGKVRPLLMPQSDVISGAIHPAKPILALGTGRGRIAFFDLATGEQAGPAFEQPGEIVDLVFNSDGSRMATRSSLGTVCIWDSANPKEPLAVHDGDADGDETNPVGGMVQDRGFAMGEEVLARSLDGAHFLTLDGDEVRLHAHSSEETIFIIAGTNEDSITGAAYNRDASMFASASRNETIQVWSATTGEPVTTSALKPGGEVTSLGFHPGGEILAAGLNSGKVFLYRVPSGESADRETIEGRHRCTRVAFSADGQLLATVFEQGPDSYARVWDTETRRPVSGELATGTSMSDAAFIDDGRRLVLWSQPSRTRDGGAGIASVWDVSVSGGNAAPAWLPEVAASLGGSRLDEESIAVPVLKRIPLSDSAVRPSSERDRVTRFFKWLEEFPSTRGDSPFRPPVSDAYVESLVRQPEFALLDEAVRLRPGHALALARRGVLRLTLLPESADSERARAIRVISSSGLINARLLASEDPEVEYYSGILHEALGERKEAEAAYARSKSLGELDLPALLDIVEVQNRIASQLRTPSRIELLGRAILAAGNAGPENAALVSRLRIQRFQVNLANASLEAADEDWEIIKRLERLPGGYSAQSLLASYLSAAEAEAVAEMGKGESGLSAAIERLRPVAVLAELSNSFLDQDPESDGRWKPSSALSNLLEWETRDYVPSTFIAADAVWKYRDDGSDQGTAWKEPGFDDSAWDKGPAKLGYGRDGETTTLQFGPDVTNKFITTYFRHEFQVDEGSRKRFLYANVVRDDGVIVYLNGAEIERDQMPAGPVTFETLANAQSGFERGDELRPRRFAIDPNRLQTGRNVIAAEIHQYSVTSSDIALQLELLGADHLPESLLLRILEGEPGEELRKRAVSMIPAPLRAEWQKVLNLPFETPFSGSMLTSDRSMEAGIRLLAILGNHEEGLTLIDRQLEKLSGKFTPVQVRQRKEWLARKEQFLLSMGAAPEEVQAAKDAILQAPPRDPSLSPKLIDLTDHYTASIYDHRGWMPNFPIVSMPDLPETFVPRKGVHFDLRGAVQLESGNLDESQDGQTFNERWACSYPEKVEGIKIGQKTTAIHFLTSCYYGDDVAKGEEVAKFVIHFEDGSVLERPVRKEDDVADWFFGRELSGSVVGWRGWNGNGAWRITLSEIVWENPQPGQTIESIDFISSLKAAAPFLVGVTLE